MLLIGRGLGGNKPGREPTESHKNTVRVFGVGGPVYDTRYNTRYDVGMDWLRQMLGAGGGFTGAGPEGLTREALEDPRTQEMASGIMTLGTAIPAPPARGAAALLTALQTAARPESWQKPDPGAVLGAAGTKPRTVPNADKQLKKLLGAFRGQESPGAATNPALDMLNEVARREYGKSYVRLPKTEKARIINLTLGGTFGGGR